MGKGIQCVMDLVRTERRDSKVTFGRISGTKFTSLFMKTLSKFPWLALILVATSISFSSAADSKSLPRSTPEAQGVSSSDLLGFVETLEREIDEMHSFILVRHGHVIAEGWWAPYDATRNHVLYSLSKSFTSTAVGMAVAEDRLSVDDRVLKFFPEDAPAETTENLRAMRVRDLLSMSAGHEIETASGADLVSAKSFLAHPVPHEPGTFFKYNTPATFMLSAIVQKLTGEAVVDYLQPRLFKPLGISNPIWDANFQGISLGGYGLRVRTEDIAKLGQLYLQKGMWQGEQLIPATWVSQATTKQISNGSNPDNDWNQGYGFQFWRSRHNSYRGDGAFGQYCFVMEDHGAVLAITSGVRDMQKTMSVVWDNLLPAFEESALPSNPGVQTKLVSKLMGLELSKPAGKAQTTKGDEIFGRKFHFDENAQGLEAISISRTNSDARLTLAIQQKGITVNLPLGINAWAMSRGPMGPFPDEPIAGSAAWTQDDTLAIKLAAYETPYAQKMSLAFNGDSVTVDSEFNVSFGPSKQPQLIGHTR